MSVYILHRLMQSVAAVLLMSLVVFLAVSVVGDRVEMLVSPEMTQAEREAVAHNFGLDRPIYEQYFIFLGNALSGDLGKSFIFGEPALKLIAQRMPATLELAISALLLAVLVGVPLGLYAGLKPKSPASRLIMAGSILGFSLPTFWVGIMLIMVFAVMLGWLPSTGRGETVSVLGIDLSFLPLDGLRHLVLPAMNLALLKVPVVTVLGLEFGSLIAFSVVTESVFAWPGMGKLLLDAIIRLDRPLIVAYLMVIVALFIAINLAVDILYSLLDPRVR